MNFKRASNRFGYNMMLFDMGLNIGPNMTAVDIRRAIDAADELFDVVMIAEKMDESLILLKEHLCWDYSDIIFFSKNARRYEMKIELSVSSLEKLRELNSGDVLLYDHFLAKHEKAVLRYGESKMADQVALLRSLRDQFFEDCGTREVESFNLQSIFKEYSNQVNGYVIDKNSGINCLLLTLPELRLIDEIRNKFRQQRAPRNSGKINNDDKFNIKFLNSTNRPLIT